MPSVVKLSDALINDARPYANAMHRSIPKQIEYWARLGKAAEENPDLPISMIQDIFVSLEEAKAGNFQPYKFG
jgi:ParD-like antitoxin of type II bacterial toxin-antitoxin system